MGAPPDIRFGILKCRDLVQLYYGARMVNQAINSILIVGDTSPHLLLNQDPRRIAYELIFTGNNATAGRVQVGNSSDEVANNLGEQVFVNTVDTIVLTRSFLTAGDSVCQPVWVRALDNGLPISARSIILTPIPIDEIP